MLLFLHYTIPARSYIPPPIPPPSGTRARSKRYYTYIRKFLQNFNQHPKMRVDMRTDYITKNDYKKKLEEHLSRAFINGYDKITVETEILKIAYDEHYELQRQLGNGYREDKESESNS